MSGWHEFRIEDFAEIQNQKRIPLSSTERSKRQGIFPYYGASGIVDYIFDGEYVLVSEDGENLKTRKTPIAFKAIGQFWVNNHAHILKCKKSYLNDLIIYYFKNLDLNEFITGAVQPKLNKASLCSIPIFLPKEEVEQKAIAAVLSSLDDKIDLLHRQNLTLEAMAETLFRQWFIEEVQEDWEGGTLGDILSSIESGSRPKGGIDPELKFGIPSIGAENINGIGNYDFSKTKFITKDFFQSMKRGVVKSHDVLVYKDGAYVGKKSMFGNEFPYDICSVNEHVFILRSNRRVNQFFLYFLLEQDQLSQLNANSAQPGLNQEAMKSFEITIPPQNLVDDFREIVEPWVDKIFFNSNQIRTLEKLRNNLLPKLMSGEVRIAL